MAQAVDRESGAADERVPPPPLEARVSDEKQTPVYRFTEMARKAKEKIKAIDFKLPGWTQIATELVPKLRDARAAAHKAMREALGPVEEAEKKIRAEWAPILDTFDQGKTFLEGKIARELKEAEDRERAERKRLDDEAAAAQTEVEAALLRGAEAKTAAERKKAVAAGQAALQKQEEARAAAAAPVDKPTVKTASGASATTKTTWEFEVTDISKVPDHLTYREIDRKLTAAAIKAMDERGEAPSISGLKIWPTSKASVRKGR